MEKDSKQGICINNFLSFFAIKCLKGYQLVLSPWIGNQCRFTPSCSNYAIDAYRHFNFFKASWLTIKRVVKCNPWHEGGIDEAIPVKKTKI
jgi:putative membrane protein insertion efficiency factor